MWQIILLHNHGYCAITSKTLAMMYNTEKRYESWEQIKTKKNWNTRKRNTIERRRKIVKSYLIDRTHLDRDSDSRSKARYCRVDRCSPCRCKGHHTSGAERRIHRNRWFPGTTERFAHSSRTSGEIDRKKSANHRRSVRLSGRAWTSGGRRGAGACTVTYQVAIFVCRGANARGTEARRDLNWPRSEKRRAEGRKSGSAIDDTDGLENATCPGAEKSKRMD